MYLDRPSNAEPPRVRLNGSRGGSPLLHWEERDRERRWPRFSRDANPTQVFDTLGSAG